MKIIITFSLQVLINLYFTDKKTRKCGNTIFNVPSVSKSVFIVIESAAIELLVVYVIQKIKVKFVTFL